MTRGKYSSRAESAQARESAIAEAAQLRREVEQLAKDLANARVRHAKELAAARDQIAQQQDYIERQSSAKVDELQERVDRLRSEKLDAESRIVKAVESNDKMFNAIRQHYQDEHGYTGSDAVQEIAGWFGPGYVTEVAALRAGLTSEAAYRIDRARGLASGNRPLKASSAAVEVRPW